MHASMHQRQVEQWDWVASCQRLERLKNKYWIANYLYYCRMITKFTNISIARMSLFTPFLPRGNYLRDGRPWSTANAKQPFAPLWLLLQ